MAFEERIREIENGLARDEKAKNDHQLSIVQRHLTDTEKTAEQFNTKVNHQSVDIDGKRSTMTDAVLLLEDKLRSIEEDVSDKRLLLARKQDENKRIGHALRLKVDQIDKTDNELRDMKRTFEKLSDMERERKEAAKQKHLINKALMYSKMIQ